MAILDRINGPSDTRGLKSDELICLADEVRAEIISAVSETGGHLGSNLGVVELTIALHHVFNLPSDKIIWDVSHQTYTHKLLTGRRDKIDTLRRYKGLAGYAKRAESEYDAFGAGHASTSISAALGFAVARDIQGRDNHVVAVIGDGAMTGGLAFEAMNNVGSLKKDMLVILNDNTWSISKNVGSISKYLTTIMADEKFNKLRKEIWELTGRFKRRDRIRQTIHHIEESIKGFLVPGLLFERLGFRYLGPIDGHDLPLLIRTLNDVKNINGPVMLHVATTKGKGFDPAEEDTYRLHGVGKFDKITGVAAKSDGGLPSYTQVFGRTMMELAADDDRVVAITAAMSSGTGLDGFEKEYPKRFFDVGIAEAHANCFAAGLAAEGVRPYVAVYSTFMQRAYDQIIHDMAIQKLPVVICMDRAGLVGNDGPTHHGTFDIPFLSTIPGLTLAAPKDGNEFRAMLHHSIKNDPDSVLAIRFPRDTVPDAMRKEVEPIEWGRWEWLTDRSETVILACGTMVAVAQDAANILKTQGLDAAVVNARFIKPLDTKMLSSIVSKARTVVTVEEGQVLGGFGQQVLAWLVDNQFSGTFKAIGIPDRFVAHGSREELLAEVGLTAESVAAVLSEVTDSKSKGSVLRELSIQSDDSNSSDSRSGRLPMTGTDQK